MLLVLASHPEVWTWQCTDEEVERGYEEFYEDVHTEFLKFGEIVNFKVCKNGSSHLRGNVYVHYKSLESAVLAYSSINGRFFAGKQITCEFVSVTKWKVAICGEYMKSRLKTCSRGTACNFIHCFRNPGGDYEWADWDNPPPRYWVKKMAALFGPSDESGYNRDIEPESQGSQRNTCKYRHHSRRSRSKDRDWSYSGSGRDYSDEHSFQRSSRSGRQSHFGISRKERSFCGEDRRCQENINFNDSRRNDNTFASDNDSGEDQSDRDTRKGQRYSRSSIRSSCRRKGEDLPDDRGKFAGKHKSDESERYEGRDELLSHDAHRKYSDTHGVQNHSYSNSRWYSKPWIEEADSLDEHSKSEDSCEFDTPGLDDQRRKSHDQGSSHYDETMDQPGSWKTETRRFDEHEVTREYSFDDHEKKYGRYKPNDISGGQNNESRSRSKQSSHRSHSTSWEKGRDSSDGERESLENLDRRKHQKNRSHNQGPYDKENKSQKKEISDETTSSVISQEKSGCGQAESCDLDRWNPSSCGPFDPHKCRDGAVKFEDIEHGKNLRTIKQKRLRREEEEYDNTQIMEDGPSMVCGDSLRLKRASRKRSRSQSPVRDLGRSRRERSYHRGEGS